MERYGTATGAREYWTARGLTIPAGWTDDKINSDLLVGSEFVDGRYGSSFPGLKLGAREQIRLWPRIDAFDSNGDWIDPASTPREVEYAAYEAAYRQGQRPGSLSIDWTPGKYKSAAVAGAVSVTYAQFSSSAAVQPQFAIIDTIISPVLATIGRGSFSGLSGATSRV